MYIKNVENLISNWKKYKKKCFLGKAKQGNPEPSHEGLQWHLFRPNVSMKLVLGYWRTDMVAWCPFNLMLDIMFSGSPRIAKKRHAELWYPCSSAACIARGGVHKPKITNWAKYLALIWDTGTGNSTVKVFSGTWYLPQEFLKDYCEDQVFLAERRKVLRLRAGLTEKDRHKVR